jgi:hypothetical protein
MQSKKIATRSESEAIWGYGKQQLTGSISNEP